MHNFLIFQGTVDHVTELNGHVSSVKAVDADQNLAVTASRDRTLKVWSLVDFRNIDTTLGKLNLYIDSALMRHNLVGKIYNNKNNKRIQVIYLAIYSTFYSQIYFSIPQTFTRTIWTYITYL